MSTRATIVSLSGLHLYEDYMEPGQIGLDIDDFEHFDWSMNGRTVTEVNLLLKQAHWDALVDAYVAAREKAREAAAAQTAREAACAGHQWAVGAFCARVCTQCGASNNE